jgi:hypothetical protein
MILFPRLGYEEAQMTKIRWIPWDKESDTKLLALHREGKSFKECSKAITTKEIPRSESGCYKRYRTLTGKVGKRKPKYRSFVDQIVQTMGTKVMSSGQLEEVLEHMPKSNNPRAYILSVFSGARNRDGSKVFEAVKRGHYRVSDAARRGEHLPLNPRKRSLNKRTPKNQHSNGLLPIVFKLQDGSVTITLEGSLANKETESKFRKVLGDIVAQT